MAFKIESVVINLSDISIPYRILIARVNVLRPSNRDTAMVRYNQLRVRVAAAAAAATGGAARAHKPACGSASDARTAHYQPPLNLIAVDTDLVTCSLNEFTKIALIVLSYRS